LHISQEKIQKRRSRSLANDAFDFFFSRSPERPFKGVGSYHMYTFLPPIYIPKTLCGEPSPVSTQIKLSLDLSQPEGRAVPLGFCCGGFSSTAGYVPGNEARSLESPEGPTALRAASHPSG
jgi:hypothetical protein